MRTFAVLSSCATAAGSGASDPRIRSSARLPSDVERSHDLLFPLFLLRCMDGIEKSERERERERERELHNVKRVLKFNPLLLVRRCF